MSLETALSVDRLQKYRVWVNNDARETLALYTLNVALSESFYTTLHMLEITLRNSVHDRLRELHGDNWFSDKTIINDKYQRDKVAEARRKIGKNASGGKVVAELTLGFWTALFSSRNNHLWGQSLRPIFDASRPLQRKQIARRLNHIRRLRNRIAHHEPILAEDLVALHQEASELIGWMSTDALAWCNKHCRFLRIHPKIPIIVGNLKNPELQL